MKKLLVTGAWWMLASDFLQYASGNFEIIWLTKEELDITDIYIAEKKIKEIQPDCILNCAAYTQVDTAEGTWKDLCYAVNTLWVGNLATIAAQEGIDFITLSTDYVFDGTKSEGYHEKDICNPLNEYGKSKYEGECRALQINPNTLIVRTSWLYGGWRDDKNFVNTMLSLAEKKTEITVIHDQFWFPTNCQDLARALIQIISNIEKYRGSILHLTNTTPLQWVSWYDFAQKIFSLAGKNISVIPISSHEYNALAKRPKNSRLINTSDIILRNWEESLKEYLDYISS